MKKRTSELLIALVIVIILAIVVFKFKDILFNQQNLISAIKALGIWGPIILIAIIIIQGILSIFPIAILFFAAGVLYGGLFGAIYSIIGYTFGAIITFYLAKKYGRDLERKWVAKKKTEHFEKILKRRGAIGVFLGRILVIFPADVVSFAAGIAEIKIKKFVIATILGVLPIILAVTFLGTAIISYLSNKWVLAIVGIIFITILIIHKFHHKIAKRIHHKNT
jgi:uncharacterized membrane protein YdjX (TVP38/TMEM64 family)